MATDLQKGIDELEHFSATLKNACGLYTSASELVKYCFPHRTLRELIETLWCAELKCDGRQKIRKAVCDFTQPISTNTASAIMIYAKEKSVNFHLKTKELWELYDKCSGEKLADVLSNCLFLFHAIYDIRYQFNIKNKINLRVQKSLRSIPYLFSLDEVGEFDRLYYATKQFLNQTGLDDLKKKLPNAVLEMYGQKIRSRKEAGSIFTHKTFLFSTSEALNTERIDADESIEKFTENVEKFISNIALHNFDTSDMHKLVECDLTGKVDFHLFKKVCDVLPRVEALADLHFADEFLKVLKYIACSYNDWNAIMTYFYGAFRDVNGSPKTFKHLYQNFDEDVRNLLSYLEDHAQLHTNQVKFQKAVDECAWILMISPLDTLTSLFLQFLENILMVPNFIRILRKLPEYCNIELEAVFGEDRKSARKTPILMLVLRTVLTIERASLQSDAKRRNFVYMCAAVCRERHVLKDGKSEAENEDDNAEAAVALLGDIVDFALVDGSVVLNHIVLPALKQVFYQDIALEIGSKLLTSLGARRTPIIWKTEQGVKLSDCEGGEVKNNSGVSIIQLISILLDIIIENKYYDDYALIDSCQDCLRLLEDGLIIETNAFNSLLTCFDNSLWAYRYAIVSWFFKCLTSYKREIPPLLFKALKEENRQALEVMKTDADDSDISGRSLLRKLFELAAIHFDLALDILKGFSTSVSIAGHDISGAFVDVIRNHNRFPRNKIDGLVEVIRAIVNQIDLSRQIVPLLTEISESSFYGLRLIEPLLLIQEAVICAIYYDKKSTEDLNAVPFHILEIENEVAVTLLKLFCELTKDHIQKEMVDLRRSHLKHKVEIKDPMPKLSDVNINRTIRVETELIQLYFASIVLANHIIGLTNVHIEMGRMKLGPTFDEIINKALVDQNAKEDMVNSEQYCEKLCAVSDFDQALASVEMNNCLSVGSFAVSNPSYETNRMIDITSANIEAIRDSYNDRLPETSEQNAMFIAGTQMIKDPTTARIIENHFYHNKRNNMRKLAVRPKPRHGALLPWSIEDNNIHDDGNKERQSDDQNDAQDNTSCEWNNNSESDRIINGGFRHTNKRRK
uniref:THO complex subunit 2 n=1 Tax=Elaeophora elaphi TaxID=1147741 RepID=A0A0R3RZR4_9BILA